MQNGGYKLLLFLNVHFVLLLLLFFPLLEPSFKTLNSKFLEWLVMLACMQRHYPGGTGDIGQLPVTITSCMYIQYQLHVTAGQESFAYGCTHMHK